MTKVVYNACYGGFSLSKQACLRYWELQGRQIWIEDGICNSFTVWFIPPEERLKKKEWSSMTVEERVAFSNQCAEQTWNERNVSRHDPILVQVVEELGKKANGDYANLHIVEVDGPYRIDEYDGSESVNTPDDYDWICP